VWGRFVRALRRICTVTGVWYSIAGVKLISANKTYTILILAILAYLVM